MILDHVQIAQEHLFSLLQVSLDFIHVFIFFSFRIEFITNNETISMRYYNYCLGLYFSRLITTNSDQRHHIKFHSNSRRKTFCQSGVKILIRAVVIKGKINSNFDLWCDPNYIKPCSVRSGNFV